MMDCIRRNFLLVIICMALNVSVQAENEPKKIICYWDCKVNVSLIDAAHCSYIIYTSLGVTASGILTYSFFTESLTISFLKKAAALKSKHPGLKVLVSIGGYEDGNMLMWSKLARTFSSRVVFSYELITYLSKYNLDGIELDWEYPRGYPSHKNKAGDKKNYGMLLDILKRKLPKNMTIACLMGHTYYPDGFDLLYNVTKMFNACDFISVHTWHRGFFDRIRLTLAVYPPAYQLTSIYNVQNFLAKIMSFPVDHSKIFMSVSAYGKIFRFNQTITSFEPKELVKQEVANTTLCQEISFREACQNVRSGFKIEWDDEQKAVYGYKGMDWMTYDNVVTVTEKVKFIADKGIGGIAVWRIDGDDFDGSCGQGRNPLFQAVIKTLNNR